MKTFSHKIKNKLHYLSPVLPFGAFKTWDDLNPKLYLAVHIYWLKFYGLWYNGFSPKSLLFWVQLLYTLIVLWLVCFMPGIGEVVYLQRRAENIGTIAEGLYLFLSEMYTYVKLTVFWINKKKILGLLSYLHCKEFVAKEAEHKELILKSIKTARFVMTYYSIMCVCAVSVGIVMPITENFEVLPTNVEYPFFSVNNTRTYKIIYLHHIYYKPATCIIDGVMDTMLAAFIVSAIGQIEILSFNLRHFDLMAERKQKRTLGYYGSQSKSICARAILRDCIIHHNSIIRYIAMIEDAFSMASALQFMLSVMVLCLVGVQFLSIEEPTAHTMQMVWMGIYLSCMLIEVFILCWFGNELMWKSQQLSQAVMEGPWIGKDKRTTIYLIIMLERCKKPLRVTAAKIFTLSLDTYTVLINWAYKAFAVMSKMKK